MIKEIYTQLCLHSQMSGINTIVFTPSLGDIFLKKFEFKDFCCWALKE